MSISYPTATINISKVDTKLSGSSSLGAVTPSSCTLTIDTPQLSPGLPGWQGTWLEKVNINGSVRFKAETPTKSKIMIKFVLTAAGYKFPTVSPPLVSSFRNNQNSDNLQSVIWRGGDPASGTYAEVSSDGLTMTFGDEMEAKGATTTFFFVLQQVSSKLYFESSDPQIYNVPTAGN